MEELEAEEMEAEEMEAVMVVVVMDSKQKKYQKQYSMVIQR